jgi:predicted dehydrogenase
MAIVGVGANVFTMHAPALQRHSADIDVVGVADVNLSAAELRGEELGCPAFGDHRALLDATAPDVAVVLAPHSFHAQITIDCLRAGAHVLTEKPIAVEVAEADRMIAAAGAAGRLLAVNLQHRTRAEIRTARRLIAEGRLGRIQRVEMVAMWTRTRAYYRLASWRGTWLGEGGGVLMNQAPHNLDLVCHLAGLPRRVSAWNRTLFHAIQTEDTSMAMLEWPDGAMGTLLVSTAMAGEPERLLIAGTRGVLQIGPGGLRLSEVTPDLDDFLMTSPEPFGAPQLADKQVSLEAGEGEHADIYANLVAAVRNGVPLVADGEQGRLSLELANALIMSSQTDAAVELPLDRARYTRVLDDLRRRVSRR